MVVYPQEYAIGNPTPEPPVKRWRFKTKTPLHIQQSKIRMTKRPETARARPPPPPFDFLEETASARAGAAPGFSGATDDEVDSAHDKAYRAMPVPCADEVATEGNPLRLFSAAQSRRIQTKPVAERFDYSKHRRGGDDDDGNVASAGWGEWQVPRVPSPTAGGGEALNGVQRLVVKTLASRDDVAACASVQANHRSTTKKGGSRGSPGGMQRRPSQAMMRRELIASRKMTDVELDEAIAEEERRDAARKPRFQSTGLKGIPNIFGDARQQEMERDVLQDAVLVKMRRNVQADLRSKAMTALRRDEMRASMRKTMRTNFEQALREKHPHALTRAEGIILDEWRAADLRKLKEDRMGPEYQHRGHEDVDSDDEMLIVSGLPDKWKGTKKGANDGAGSPSDSRSQSTKPTTASARKPERPSTAPNVAAYRQYASKRMVSGMTENLQATHGRPIDVLAKRSTDDFGRSEARRPANTRLAAPASKSIVKSMTHIPSRPKPPSLAIRAGGEELFHDSAFITQQIADIDRHVFQ